VSEIEFGISMLHCLGEPFKLMINKLESIDTNLVEIVDDGYHTLNKRRISILKEISQSYEIQFTIHSPFADINISSPSKPMLNFMIKRLKRSMKFANALDAKLWVFHPGIMTGISMFYPGLDWKQNIESIKFLSNCAKELGIKIAIENLPNRYGFVMSTPEHFQKLFEESNLEDVGIVLDTGHSNLESKTEAFLRELPEKIFQIHISDNMGSDDQHLEVGKGNIDWNNFAKIISEINYKKIIMIETVENVQSSLSKIKNLLNYL
jgi:sugar phosphate isomerase/epimerase